MYFHQKELLRVWVISNPVALGVTDDGEPRQTYDSSRPGPLTNRSDYCTCLSLYQAHTPHKLYRATVSGHLQEILFILYISYRYNHYLSRASTPNSKLSYRTPSTSKVPSRPPHCLHSLVHSPICRIFSILYSSISVNYSTVYLPVTLHEI